VWFSRGPMQASFDTRSLRQAVDCKLHQGCPGAAGHEAAARPGPRRTPIGGRRRGPVTRADAARNGPRPPDARASCIGFSDVSTVMVTSTVGASVARLARLPKNGCSAVRVGVPCIGPMLDSTPFPTSGRCCCGARVRQARAKRGRETLAVHMRQDLQWHGRCAGKS
jgi:hypothetical protein